LNRARTALLGANRNEGCVTEIATELGFTELGRFSVRYRQMFGESPSETLRRQTATIVSFGF
jgi:transcriptional regulator GlxA family with amidase domain